MRALRELKIARPKVKRKVKQLIMAMQSRAAQNDGSASQLASQSWKINIEMVKAPVYLTGKARRINHKPARRLKAC